ncbi:hypothetical protein PsYK624_090370 [Phanerochaete sordida]|uniref:F-box domain-containing protein n=1 Tax=Phanerochaete sordida TaxID=48140 RepID=A0A9P3GEI4_9APHY|nr:hypothetical protein PsYK624_090370 [Phanerochaete sordida]
MEDDYDSLEDLDTIDAAIAKYRSIVQRLCTIRNSRVPIWRIPDEILSKIFLLIVSERFYDWYSNTENTPPQPYKWMQIAYVCRHWHRVCVATHQLWAFVDLGNPERTRVLLRLSGTAPLTLISRMTFEQDALHLCLAEMSRIRHFLFEPPYPLEYLASDDGRPYLPPITGVSRVLTLHLSLATPAFTKLFLSSSLTHLRCGFMEPQFSVREMIAVLDSVPCLVDLELVEALQSISPPDSHNLAPDRQAVALPALRRMELQDSSTAGVSCATLLQYIELPPQASVSMNFGSNANHPQEAAVIVDTLRRAASRVFSRGNLPQICCIRREEHAFQALSTGQFGLVFKLQPTVQQLPELLWTLYAPHSPSPGPGHVTITLRITPHWSEDALVDTFLSTLPLANVSMLVAQLRTFPDDIWIQLARIANVTHVSAAPHEFAYDLMKALAALSDPPFPKLQVLMLGNICWDKGLLGPEGGDVPLSKRCHDALQARLAQGAPLRSLSLRGAIGVDEAELIALQDSGLVKKVELVDMTGVSVP